VTDAFLFFAESLQKCKVKTSRLLFLKRNRMLCRLSPVLKKNRREVEALFANNSKPFTNEFYLLVNGFSLKNYF